MTEDRYIVVGVSGYTINPGSGSEVSHGEPPTSYSVLDTVDCYREVEKFYVSKNSRSYLLRRKAHRLAAELNQVDRDYERQFEGS